jgi:hypothetical protein
MDRDHGAFYAKQLVSLAAVTMLLLAIIPAIVRLLGG